MTTAIRKTTLALGIVLVGMILSGNAFAKCGDYAKLEPSAFLLPQLSDGQFAALLPVSASASDDPIVGMWHTKFTAQGNELGPPDGTPIDNALVLWHADGTEMMNSYRPPQDGQWCMGIWKRTGRTSYVLNHIPWFGNDTSGGASGIGNPQGPTRFFEKITLSPDHNHYTGTFTLDAYDTAGNHVAHVIGVIDATRVTIDTTVPELL
jgi:hypothetical protein